MNEATKTQINYTLDESEFLNRGPNGTLSLVFDGIKRFNRGEKHLKITCDNTVGQNKNNITLWFLVYLVICGYYETIELNFMIAGHTKFNVDSYIGLIKKLFRKTEVNCLDDFIKVVEKSSPAGYNRVQCYENGQGFKYYDIRGTLEKYFIKLPNIAKYHHFFFSVNNLGVVRFQEFADSPFVEFNLWKDKGKVAKNIREIRSLVFPVLVPSPLSSKRQKDFYEISSLMKKEYRDTVCSQIVIDNQNTL